MSSQVKYNAYKNKLTKPNNLLITLSGFNLVLTTINMANLHYFNRKISKYQSLQRICPSPLFRNKIRKVIDLYETAAATPDSKILLENAEASSSEFDEGWTELHSDMDCLITVRQTVILVVQFLYYKLLEDYFGRSYPVSDHMLGCIDAIIKQRRHSGDGEPSDSYSKTSNTTRRFGFIFPLEEMDLNTPYLMQKFLTVARRRGKPNNDVQSLIEEQNWPQLATALINDRVIVTMIAEENPDCGKFVESTLGRIDRYQTTHFKELHTPTNYIVRTDSIPSLPTNRHSEGKGILSTMTASLFGGKKPRSDENWEAESSSLLHAHDDSRKRR